MAIRVSLAIRNACLNGGSVAEIIDGVSGNGTIDIHAGAVHASFGTVPAGAKLATWTLARPSFGTPSSGSMSANSITSDISADASGTPASFVLRNSSSTIEIDGAVSISAGVGDIKFPSVTWTAGDTIACSALAISIPQT